MSKMLCRCGNTMSDTLFPCPTEASLLRQQDHEKHDDDIARNVMNFFRAIQMNQRAQWIQKFFGSQYPATESDESVVLDIIGLAGDRFIAVAECEKCGRLWVQSKPGENSYRSYAPDEPGYAAVLRANK